MTEFKASVTALDRLNIGIFNYNPKSTDPLDRFKLRLVTLIGETTFFNFGSENDRTMLRKLNGICDKWGGETFLPYLNALTVLISFYLFYKRGIKLSSEIIKFYSTLSAKNKKHTTPSGLIRYVKFMQI